MNLDGGHEGVPILYMEMEKYTNFINLGKYINNMHDNMNERRSYWLGRTFKYEIRGEFSPLRGVLGHKWMNRR